MYKYMYIHTYMTGMYTYKYYLYIVNTNMPFLIDEYFDKIMVTGGGVRLSFDTHPKIILMYCLLICYTHTYT